MCLIYGKVDVLVTPGHRDGLGSGGFGDFLTSTRYGGEQIDYSTALSFAGGIVSLF
jgi:hypothetical protein